MYNGNMREIFIPPLKTVEVPRKDGEYYHISFKGERDREGFKEKARIGSWEFINLNHRPVKIRVLP